MVAELCFDPQPEPVCLDEQPLLYYPKEHNPGPLGDSNLPNMIKKPLSSKTEVLVCSLLTW